VPEKYWKGKRLGGGSVAYKESRKPRLLVKERKNSLGRRKTGELKHRIELRKKLGSEKSGNIKETTKRV